MKNLSYVFYPAIVVFIFGSMFFGDDYSSWQRERRNKKIAEAKARNDERDKKLEAYKNLDPMAKLAMNPPSPEAIAQARQEWGITGEPTY